MPQRPYDDLPLPDYDLETLLRLSGAVESTPALPRRSPGISGGDPGVSILADALLGGGEPSTRALVNALRGREALGEAGMAGGSWLQPAAAAALQGARGRLADQGEKERMLLKRSLWSQQQRQPEPLADQELADIGQTLGLDPKILLQTPRRQATQAIVQRAAQRAAEADRAARDQTPEAIAAREAKAAADRLDRESKGVTIEEKRAALASRPSEDEAALRKEWIGQAPYKNAQAAIEQFQKAETSSENAAGDLSLIFSYMKMLDPGSAVREGEFANAQNASGIPDRIVAAYNKALSGERLSPDARKRFRDESRAVLKSTLDAYEQNAEFYRKIAKDRGFRVENVVPPMRPLPPKAKPTSVPGAKPTRSERISQLKAQGVSKEEGIRILQAEGY